MNPNQKIRMEARGRLRGNWGIALGLTGIWIAGTFLLGLLRELGMFLTGLIDQNGAVLSLSEAIRSGFPSVLWYVLIPVFTVLAGLFLLAPLWLGFLRWFAFLAHGQSLEAGTVFYYYTPAHIAAALKFLLSFFARVAGWSLLGLLPGAAALVVVVLSSDAGFHLSGALVLLCDTLSIPLLIGGVALLATRLLRYFAAPYLFVCGMRPEGCIRTSGAAMYGYKSSAFGLSLSFIGWALLCVFAFPMLYVFPYFTESTMVASKWIVREHFSRQAQLRHDAPVFSGML